MMKLRLKLTSIFILLLIVLPNLTPVFPYTTVIANGANGISTNRGILDIDGWIYAFYVSSADNKIYYKSSADNVAYGAAQTASNTTVDVTTYGGEFIVYATNAGAIYLVYRATGHNVLAKNGTASAGTITWFNGGQELTLETPVAENNGFFGDMIENYGYVYLVYGKQVPGLDANYTFRRTLATQNAFNTGTSFGLYSNQLDDESATDNDNSELYLSNVTWASDTLMLTGAPYKQNHFRTHRIAFDHATGAATSVNSLSVGTKALNKHCYSCFSTAFTDTEIFIAYATTADSAGMGVSYSFFNASLTWQAPAVAESSSSFFPRLAEMNSGIHLVYTNASRITSANSTAELWQRNISTTSVSSRVALDYLGNVGMVNTAQKTASGVYRLPIYSQDDWSVPPQDTRVTLISETAPPASLPNVTLAVTGLSCGNIWVTPDKTYMKVTATVQAQAVIQNASVRFNDSLHTIQADYDNTTARWNLSQGRDYVSLNPQATATSYFSASPDNYTLQVQFMFLANERILDKNDVDIQYRYALQNGTQTSWTSGATMNIYNKGGATEYVIQNNAGFLPGGDVYSVYAKNTSQISVNQTWVRLQHLHANFAIRLVLNTTNSGEDNLWQDFAHKGTNEYYTNSTDWTIYYKIWYYDEQNGAWVQGWILSFVKQQGDIGSADEWTQFNVTFYNGPNSEKTLSQNMSAWVEREPEARVRLWLDLWFNKMNASSVHGARLNPMYFGIHYTGWAIWGTGVAGQWEPMYKNESQAAAFDRLEDANANKNVTSPMLTCMKTEQILVMNDNTYALEGISPLHYNYTLQIDNWDVLEPKLSPTRNMEGVNTPLIVEPLLPDKTASSFWAPIYAALASIGGWIFKAFSALAEIVWQAVRAQFPWFAEWVDNVNAALANGIEMANEMLSGLVEILKMVGGQIWIFGFITDFIQQTWELIYPLLSPFTSNSTVWITLLIIVFEILPIGDNLSRGRWDLVRGDLEMVWGFMRTIIIGIYVIVTTVVGWIIQALPL